MRRVALQCIVSLFAAQVVQPSHTGHVALTGCHVVTDRFTPHRQLHDDLMITVPVDRQVKYIQKRTHKS